MKRIVYLFIIFLCHSLGAQVHTPLDSLIQSVEVLYTNKQESLSIELHTKNKFRFLNYMPSVGYDFYNHRPILTYNVSALAGFLNNSQAQKNKQLAIDRKVNLELTQAKKIIATHYLQLQDLFSTYHIEYDIYELNMKLYEIELEKYRNNEIPLEIFIEKQINIKEKEKNMYRVKEKIFHTILTLENLTNYQINYEIKNFITVSNPDIP